MELPDVINQIMDLTGWTQTRLAKAVNVSQATISKWRSGGQGPRKEEWDRVEALIQRLPHLEPLRQQGAASPSEVRVMGRIGAGAIIDPDFEQVPPEGISQVSLPFPIPAGMIAFEVVGESMFPKYDPGDIIVVREDQARSTESFIGKTAVVRTGDGRRYLKRIEIGTRNGLYRLESFNSRAAILDVEIAWVGEIYASVPAEQTFARERPTRASKIAPKSARR